MLTSLVAAVAVLSATAHAQVKVHPGGASSIQITSLNTVNSTRPDPSVKIQAQDDDVTYMSITVNNNLASENVKVYITGQDPITGQAAMLQAGATSWYFPQTTATGPPAPITDDVSIPLGSADSITIQLPGYLRSGRVYFSDGDLSFFMLQAAVGANIVQPDFVNPADPSANVNWGFMELNYDTPQNGGIYTDLSFVDFVGLPLGATLDGSNGHQISDGTTSDAVSSLCSAVVGQTAVDGAPWGNLCQLDTSGNPIRVLAPLHGPDFGAYWQPYIDQVWAQYTANPLTIQTNSGTGTCQVSNGLLNCDIDNRGYAQPTATDIWGCNSGPFGIQGDDNAFHRAAVPVLCAAFTRSTLLLANGNVQPRPGVSDFYTNAITNFYSKFVHQNEVNGIGYAYAYDDVTASGDINQSSTFQDSSPTVLTVTVGGPCDTAPAPSKREVRTHPRQFN